MSQDLIQKHRVLQYFLEHFESTDPAVQAKANALKDKVHKYWESYSSLVSGTYISNETALKLLRNDKEFLALLRAFKPIKSANAAGPKPHMRFHYTQDTWNAADAITNDNQTVSCDFRLSSDARRLPVANVGDSVWTAQTLLSPLLQAQNDTVSDYLTSASFAQLFQMPAGTLSTYPMQSTQGYQKAIEFTQSGVYLISLTLDVALKPRAKYNFRTTPTLELIDQTDGKFLDRSKLGNIDDDMPKVGLACMLFKDGYISKDVVASGNDATPWFNPGLTRFAKVYGPWTMCAAGASSGRVQRIGFSAVVNIAKDDNLLISLMRDKGKLSMTGQYVQQGQVVQVQQKIDEAITIAKSMATGSARSGRDLSNVLEITRLGEWA